MNWLKKKTAPPKLVGMAVEPGGFIVITLDWVNGRPEIDNSSFIPDEKSALRNWVNAEGLLGAPCFLVMGAEQCELVQAEKPKVPESEVAAAAGWLVRESLTTPVEESVMDYYAVPEGAGRSSKPNINLVVARKTVEGLVEQVDAAGLKLQSIDIPELTYRNVANLYATENRAIAMLVLDEGSGSILIFKNGDLYFSRHITVDAAIVDAESSEALDQLCLEVQRTFDYFESQMKQAAPASLLIYAAQAPDALADSVATKLAVETLRLDLDRLGIDVGTRQLDVDCTATVRAIGAALRGEHAAG